MEFDKTRVYTALNAYELQVGDIVFVAESMFELRKEVAYGENERTIAEILSDVELNRFRVIETWLAKPLAYLVKRPSDKESNIRKVMEIICRGNVQFRPFKDTSELIDSWFIKMGYNSKPLTKPLIWIKCKKSGVESAIIAYSERYVETDCFSIDLDELFNDYTFLDNTPCAIAVAK